MSDFFKFMAEWGVWDVFQTLITIVGGIVVFFYLFPRRSIENFYIDATRAANPPYPKVIRIEMRNLTNEPLYVLSRGFRFGDVIHASPLAAIDHATQTCEVKFPGPQPDNLTEIDTLVRHEDVTGPITLTFSAVHFVPQVPDTGSTFALMGVAIAAVFFLHRRIKTV